MIASTPSSTALAASLTSARVGRGSLAHRLQHLRRDDHGTPERARLARDLLLHARHLLERDLEPKVATRHHHRIGAREHRIEMLQGLGPLQLRDNGRARRMPLGDVSRRLDVGRALDERQRHHVDAERQAEGQVLGVLQREPRGRQGDAGGVDALVLAELAAMDDGRPDLGAVGRVDPRHHPAIVEQQLAVPASTLRASGA